MTVSDYPDWSVPQAGANAIASTGVPLLSAPGSIYSNTLVIAAGTTQFTADLPITQPGYEVTLQAYSSGSGSAGPLEISMIWLDSTNVFTISQETWDIWPAAAIGQHFLYGKGPTKGSNLQIEFINTSSAMQYTVVIEVYQRSHLYTRDDWRSRQYGSTASGGTLATSDLTTGLLAYRNVDIAAAGNDTSELPLYSGPAYLWFQTQSGTTDMTVTIQSSANPGGPALATKFMLFKSGSNGLFGAQIELPRYQARIVMNNGNAALQFCTYSLFTVEQAA